MSQPWRRLSVGDPPTAQTDLGPLARRDLLENLARQVGYSIAAGAHAACSAATAAAQGYFYPPTLLADVRPGMAAFDEETFGPVAAMVPAREYRGRDFAGQPISFGLGASIWTRDAVAAEKIAPRLDSGSVFINGPVKSDPRLPFGGIKQSGYGRELAEAGIREFVNLKTVWVKD